MAVAIAVAIHLSFAKKKKVRGYASLPFSFSII